MTAGRFRFGNRIVQSDLPLPSLPLAGSEAPHIRVRMSGAGAPHSLARWDHHWRSPGGGVSLSCARDRDGYRLGFPGVGTFSIGLSGTEIHWLPEAPTPAETIEHLLVDQVLPRVSTLRGELTLHAGAIAVEEGVIAFLGDSGAGKSTLCAACLREGAALIGDDGLVVVDGSSRGVEVVPTYPGLRLLPNSAQRVLDASDGIPVTRDSPKRRLRVEPAGTEVAPRPLLAAYLLDAGDDVTIEPLTPRERFMALARSVLHLHLDDPEAAGLLFDRLMRLAGSVPVRRLRYPRRYEVLSEVARAVLAG